MIDYSALTDEQWNNIYENRRRWIHALRCGGYEQAIGCLCKLDQNSLEPVSYCCLGVYVNTTHAEHWSQRYHDGNGQMIREVALPDYSGRSTCSLTEPLRAELAMSSDFMQCLISMNDSRYSFAQIAELLDGICGIWDATQMHAVTSYLASNRPAKPTYKNAQPPSE